MLSLSEDLGTAAGATVLAGVGGLLITFGAEWAALLLGVVGIVLAALWAIARRGVLWGAETEPDGAEGAVSF